MAFYNGSLFDVTLAGRLSKDPEMSFTASGTAVTKITIPVNRSVKKGDSYEQETVWTTISFFGKTAEKANQKMEKGTAVVVKNAEAPVTPNCWVTDGEARSSHQFISFDFTIISGGVRAENQESSPVFNDDKVSDDELPF